MSNKFEDEVLSFIAKHRALKLIFLVVATIGVFASAYSTLRPVLEFSYAPILRAIKYAPSREVKDKYFCAYELGMIRSNIQSEFEKNAQNASSGWLGKLSGILARCQALYGSIQSQLIIDEPTTSDTSSARVDNFRNLSRTLGSIYAFEGNLLRHDAAAYRLFRLATKIGLRRGILMSQFDPSAQQSLLPADSDDVWAIDEINLAFNEAQDLLTFRLPWKEMKPKSKNEFLDELIRCNIEIGKFFLSGA